MPRWIRDQPIIVSTAAAENNSPHPDSGVSLLVTTVADQEEMLLLRQEGLVREVPTRPDTKVDSCSLPRRSSNSSSPLVIPACIPSATASPLTVYLGHVRPEETYWYLTASPELLDAAVERFQHYAGTVDKS